MVNRCRTNPNRRCSSKIGSAKKNLSMNMIDGDNDLMLQMQVHLGVWNVWIEFGVNPTVGSSSTLLECNLDMQYGSIGFHCSSTKNEKGGGRMKGGPMSDNSMARAGEEGKVCQTLQRRVHLGQGAQQCLNRDENQFQKFLFYALTNGSLPFIQEKAKNP